MYSAPRFQFNTPFSSELKKRINAYFQETKMAPTGNWKLYSKALILMTSLVLVYIHLVFYTPAWGWALSEALLLGLITAAIGFNVMHDGAHGSFSKHKWLNELAGLSLNILGANVTLWKTKHNAIHHTFTNIVDVDDDIDAKPFLRMSVDQPKYGIHRFQQYYFWIAYSFLYLYWILFTDYKKYFTKRVGTVPLKPLTPLEHLSFWSFKVFHMCVFVIFPIYFVGFFPWLLGFLVYGAFTGLMLSVVFQLAHVLEETHFTEVAPGVQLEDDFTLHQLRTTANFATKSRIMRWLLGGLNFQVEHHLFPHVSHVHYPAINKIVKQACKEFSMPYLEHKYFVGALWSHMKHLRAMGTA